MMILDKLRGYGEGRSQIEWFDIGSKDIVGQPRTCQLLPVSFNIIHGHDATDALEVGVLTEAYTIFLACADISRIFPALGNAC